MIYTVKKGRISKRGVEVQQIKRNDRVYDRGDKNIGIISYDWEIGPSNTPEKNFAYVSYTLYYFPKNGGDAVTIEGASLCPWEGNGRPDRRISEEKMVARIFDAYNGDWPDYHVDTETYKSRNETCLTV